MEYHIPYCATYVSAVICFENNNLCFRTCGNMDETHCMESTSQQEIAFQLNETPPTSDTAEDSRIIKKKLEYAHSTAKQKRKRNEDNFEKDLLRILGQGQSTSHKS